MSVKAQWFVPDLVSGEVDPFADEAPVDVTAVGVAIDLRDDPDELYARIGELLEAENALYNRGVRCVVKDRADTSCHACPFQGRHGALCEVGAEQDEVLTRMAFAYEERRGVER